MAQSKKYYWLKLNEHFFSQVTIKYLRKLPQGDTVVIVYLKLLLVSLKSNGVIYLRGICSSIEDEVALLIDEDAMAVSLTLQALSKINLIEQGTEEGVLQMTDFQDMVGSESGSAVRMRNHRARKELAENKLAALPDKAKVSQCDADVTGSDNRMTDSYSGMCSDDKNAFVASLMSYSLLIIDDLGIERNTEFALEQVFNIIDERYKTRLPLIVTTNLSMNTLKNPEDIAHQRIYDRVLAMCIPVSFQGINHRSLESEQKMKNGASLFRD